jgi:hypothetical protein
MPERKTSELLALCRRAIAVHHCRSRLSVLLFLALPLLGQVHVNSCSRGDTGFSGGTCYTSPIALPAGAPSWLALERYGNFSYRFPMADGIWNVTLHFIENSSAISGVGQRQFSVSINGVPVLTSFDLAAAAPLNTPVDRSFPVTVTGGVGVTIAFTTVVRNAVVSAIDISGPPAPVWLSGASALPPDCPAGVTFYYSTASPVLWLCTSQALGWQNLSWFGTVASAPSGARLGLTLRAMMPPPPAGIRSVQSADGTLYWLVDQSGNK